MNIALVIIIVTLTGAGMYLWGYAKALKECKKDMEILEKALKELRETVYGRDINVRTNR